MTQILLSSSDLGVIIYEIKSCIKLQASILICYNNPPCILLCVNDAPLSLLRSAPDLRQGLPFIPPYNSDSWTKYLRDLSRCFSKQQFFDQLDFKAESTLASRDRTSIHL